MLRWSIITILICCFCIGRAQNLSHFTFGKKELAGIDVYDIIQDDKNDYILATDLGLMKYDGYSFERIPNPEAKSSAVFNLKKDHKGNIYCFNFQNQIFQLKGDSVKVFYTISNDSKHHHPFLEVNKDGVHLLTMGHQLFQPDGKEISNHSPVFGENQSPVSFICSNNECYSTSGNDFLIYSNGTWERTTITLDPYPSLAKRDLTYWVEINGQVMIVDRNSMDIYAYHPEAQTFEIKGRLSSELIGSPLRMHVHNDILFVAGNKNGVYAYNLDFTPLNNGAPFFPNTFITKIFSDHEDNLLLGTGGHGIKVVPNLDIREYRLPEDQKFTALERFDSSLLVGTDKGNVFKLTNNTLRPIYSDSLRRSIEKIFHWKEREEIAVSLRGENFIGKLTDNRLQKFKTFPSSLKDLTFINQDTAIRAINRDISYLIPKEANYSTRQIIQRRGIIVHYDKINQILFSASSIGLMATEKTGETNQLLFSGDTIFPTDFIEFKGQTFIGSKNHGLLSYHDHQLTQQLDFKGVIRNLKVLDDKIIFLSQNSIFAFSPETASIEKLQKSLGLTNSNINQFEVLNGLLYLTNSESLEFIDLNTSEKKEQEIVVDLDKIKVNGDQLETSKLAYNFKDLSIAYSVSSLKYQDQISYEYRLNGLHSDWRIAEYLEKSKSYNALSPGKYQFEVRAVNGNTRGPIESFSFTVTPAYYTTWWFILSAIVVVLLIVLIIYNKRIKAIRKKSQELLEKKQMKADLLETELKALRSQMNPHFIFNSLNSIQDLILKEDTDASYDYIVLFADLVRSTLNYTNQDFISLDQEMKFLDVYLSLEKLRFKEDFEYTIESNVEDAIKVPSLLLQPFIENALLHGLLHKSGLKTLQVKFEMTDQLICTITDNGIGRAKAKGIRERQNANHQSFALEAIEKRLDILRKRFEEAGYDIIDLEEDGQPLGTEVRVRMPYEQMY